MGVSLFGVVEAQKLSARDNWMAAEDEWLPRMNGYPSSEVNNILMILEAIFFYRKLLPIILITNCTEAEVSPSLAQ